jgi:hypothetical protein
VKARWSAMAATHPIVSDSLIQNFQNRLQWIGPRTTADRIIVWYCSVASCVI